MNSYAKQALGCFSDNCVTDPQSCINQSYYMCDPVPNKDGKPEGYANIPAPPTCYVNSGQPDVNSCCGCIDWSSKGIPVSETCAVPQDNTQNPWIKTVKDKVLWLSENCPAGYAYQFDDVHSTFICSTVNTVNITKTNPNTMGYAITFCPNGEEIFPATGQQ